MDISDKIKRLREFAGCTQERFSLVMGVTRAVIRDYETQKSNPKRIFLDKLAILFNIEFDYLIGEDFKMKQIKHPNKDLLDALEMYHSYLLLKNEIDAKEKVYKELLRAKAKNEDINPKEIQEAERLLISLRETEYELRYNLTDVIQKVRRPGVSDSPDFYEIVSLFQEYETKKSGLSSKRNNFLVDKESKGDSTPSSKGSWGLPEHILFYYKLTPTVLSYISNLSEERITELVEDYTKITKEEVSTLENILVRLNDINDYEIATEYHEEIFQDLKYGLLIKSLREKLSMSQKDLAQQIGFKEYHIADIERGYLSLADTTLNPLWEFLKIKLPDTIYHAGEVYTTLTPEFFRHDSKVEKNVSRALLDSMNSQYGKEFSLESTTPLARYINADVYEKYIGSPDKSKFVLNAMEYSLPPGTPYQGVEWRYFEIISDSMMPSLRTGDVGLFTLVYREDWSSLTELKTYLMCTSSSIHVGRIYYAHPDFFVMGTNIKNNEAAFVNIMDVEEIWELRRVIAKPQIIHEASDIKDFKRLRDTTLEQLRTKMLSDTSGNTTPSIK